MNKVKVEEGGFMGNFNFFRRLAALVAASLFFIVGDLMLATIALALWAFFVVIDYRQAR